MNPDKILKLIPKTDLHCHLDGSLRPETILDIVRKENIPIPTREISDFEKEIKVIGKCPSLKEYLNKFNLPIQVMQKEEHIYRATLELLEDASKQNIKYIEIRFAPFNHLKNGLTLDQVINSVITAIDYGRYHLNIMSNLILCILRQEPVEKGIELVKTAQKYIGKGVVAMDLAGNESDFPPEIHEKAFKLAKEYGLHCTIHAGETGSPENIIKSINILGAERIGHGTYAYKDKKVMNYLKENAIPLEVCITSNINTSAVKSYLEHPVKKYLDEDLIITINTDNTTVSNTNLIKEFSYLIKYQNFNFDDIKKVIRNGITSSFASKEDINKLYKEYLSTINIIELATPII